MNAELPPRWAECALEKMLALKDRQTITGDLREEYAEAILPAYGRLRATLWYALQVTSFAPHCASLRGRFGLVALGWSGFTLLSACWLAAMEMLLQHPGYFLRVAIDVSVMLPAAFTVLIYLRQLARRTGQWLRLAGIVLFGFAVRTFAYNASSAHFEGFVAVLSFTFALQGLMLVLHRSSDSPKSA